MNKKTIVTGPGRCGTTYFMKLLTELDFDTGFSKTHPSVKPEGWVGPWQRFEFGIRGRHAHKARKQPSIIKNPHLCRDLIKRAARWGWDIDHVYVLIRDYDNIADHLWDRRHKGEPFDKEIWQVYRDVAARDVGDLMYQLISEDIPYTFLTFPRIVTDPHYLWSTCALFKDISYEEFEVAFNTVADINQVHWGFNKETT